MSRLKTYELSDPRWTTKDIQAKIDGMLDALSYSGKEGYSFVSAFVVLSQVVWDIIKDFYDEDKNIGSAFYYNLIEVMERRLKAEGLASPVIVTYVDGMDFSKIDFSNYGIDCKDKDKKDDEE